jgi:hypothetical protein
VPLADLEVKRMADEDFWPVREYVVWFANPCWQHENLVAKLRLRPLELCLRAYRLRCGAAV